MQLENLPTTTPTALDPFGLLQPDERNALQQLLEEGVPIPVQIAKKHWQFNTKKARRPEVVNDTVARFNQTTNRFRCDFHPTARARYIVTAAPNGARARVNSVVCTACHERRQRFPSFQFRRLVETRSVCCREVMSDTGRVSCYGCVTEGQRVVRTLQVFATRSR